MSKMSFRIKEFLERNELVRFQLNNAIRTPANGQHQEKIVTNVQLMIVCLFLDWYNAYFKVEFKLQKLANGEGYANANMISVINGSHSLINYLMIKSAGKIIYDTNNLHKITFVKNLLQFSDDYSRSVATRNLWYLDTTGAAANPNTGFAARRALITSVGDDAAGVAKTVSTIISLNRYSFFEELEDKMLVPMQLELNIQLQDDDELIFRAAGIDTDNAVRVVVTKFQLSQKTPCIVITYHLF